MELASPRGGRVIAIAGIAVLGACGFTATAAAKSHSKKLQTATALAVASGDKGAATATATCPPKTRAIGGGFSFPPPDLAGNVVVPLLSEFQKVGQNQWRVSVVNDSPGGGSGLLTTTVYCRRGAPKTTTATGSMAVNAGAGLGTAQATCTAGRKAVAGGFLIPAPVSPEGAITAIQNSFRSTPSTWLATAVSGQSSSSVTSLVYCARKKTKPPREASAASPPTITHGSLSSATATCPGKLGAGAGGFSTFGSSSTSLHVMYESLSTGTGWKTSGLFLNFGTTVIAGLNSFAYCSK
jgi:hypothetical protein